MKTFLVAVFVAFANLVFAKPTATFDEVDAFLTSETYTQAIQSFDEALLSKVDRSQSSSFFIDKEQRVLLLTIVYTDNERITHVLRALKVPDDKLGSFGGRHYLMALVKYLNFDFESKTGAFEIYDLDNNNTNLGLFETQAGILKTAPDRTHYCDRNRDGDVTFGECLTCMISACGHNAECTTLCVVAELLAKQCWVAFRTSCGIIALFY